MQNMFPMIVYGELERIGSLKTGYWKVNSRITRSVSGSDV